MAVFGAGLQARTVRDHGLGQQTYAVRYGVTSLPLQSASAARLLVIARSAWGIEHGLHERRDVTLHEDAGQVRRGTGPQVLAALHTAVIGLVGQHGERNLAAAQRRFADHVDRALAQGARYPRACRTLQEPCSNSVVS